MKTSCIVHSEKNRAIALHLDYLNICDGNHCAAMVLRQMECWYMSKINHRPQAQIHNRLEEQSGSEATQDTDVWVYKSQAEMQAEMMGLFGERAIGEAYRLLMEKGFLTYRLNPKFAWDRTKQYLFCQSAVQQAVSAATIPQNCDTPFRKIATIEAAEMRNHSRTNAEAIPEKTLQRKPPKENIIDTKEIPLTRKPSVTEVEFSIFWNAYPSGHRGAKAKALEAYQKARAKVSAELLLERLELWKKSREWQEANGKYIKHAQGWLNGEYYEDPPASAGGQVQGIEVEAGLRGVVLGELDRVANRYRKEE